MNNEMLSAGVDVYVRIVSKTGECTVTSFRVWNRDRFFTTLTVQHEKEGGRIEAVTRDDYLKFRRGGSCK